MVRYRTRDGTEAKARRRFAWVTRNILFLALASLFADISTEMLYPILPIFLTVTLGAPAAVVGLVEGLAEGAASVTKVAAGQLSDRTGAGRSLGWATAWPPLARYSSRRPGRGRWCSPAGAWTGSARAYGVRLGTR